MVSFRDVHVRVCTSEPLAASPSVLGRPILHFFLLKFKKWVCTWDSNTQPQGLRRLAITNWEAYVLCYNVLVFFLLVIRWSVFYFLFLFFGFSFFFFVCQIRELFHKSVHFFHFCFSFQISANFFVPNFVNFFKISWIFFKFMSFFKFDEHFFKIDELFFQTRWTFFKFMIFFSNWWTSFLKSMNFFNFYELFFSIDELFSKSMNFPSFFSELFWFFLPTFLISWFFSTVLRNRPVFSQLDQQKKKPRKTRASERASKRAGGRASELWAPRFSTFVK